MRADRRRVSFARMHRFGVLGEILLMVWERKVWVLLPPVLALILVAGLLVLAQITPLGPLIYPLF